MRHTEAVFIIGIEKRRSALLKKLINYSIQCNYGFEITIPENKNTATYDYTVNNIFGNVAR